MRPSIIFATAEYVKRLREECLRENKPLHRHTRFRRQELAPDEINPDVLAMGGHIARRCSEQKRVRRCRGLFSRRHSSRRRFTYSAV
uniref:hypothetical protein n=1 Tax=Escherichia coli TaxID=562 RepID=UPI0039848C7F